MFKPKANQEKLNNEFYCIKMVQFIMLKLKELLLSSPIITIHAGN